MQVWLGDRRVGEAQVSPSPGQREIRMQVIEDIDSDYDHHGVGRSFERDYMTMTTPPQMISLKLDRVQFKIDNHLAAIEGPEYLARVCNQYGVLPSDCSVMHRADIDARIYRFDVIRVDLDQLDQIFDLNWYEPLAY